MHQFVNQTEIWNQELVAHEANLCCGRESLLWESFQGTVKASCHNFTHWSLSFIDIPAGLGNVMQFAGASVWMKESTVIQNNCVSWRILEFCTQFNWCDLYPSLSRPTATLLDSMEHDVLHLHLNNLCIKPVLSLFNSIFPISSNLFHTDHISISTFILLVYVSSKV